MTIRPLLFPRHHHSLKTSFGEIRTHVLPLSLFPMFTCDQHETGSHAYSHREQIRRAIKSTKITYDPEKKKKVVCFSGLVSACMAWTYEYVCIFLHLFWNYLIWYFKIDRLIHTWHCLAHDYLFLLRNFSFTGWLSGHNYRHASHFSLLPLY